MPETIYQCLRMWSVTLLTELFGVNLAPPINNILFNKKIHSLYSWDLVFGITSTLLTVNRMSPCSFPGNSMFFFPSSEHAGWLWNPPSILNISNEIFSNGLGGAKRQGREIYHPSPSSAEAKNAWNYSSTPQYAFMAFTGTTLFYSYKYQWNQVIWINADYVQRVLQSVLIPEWFNVYIRFLW
jgi:hypothetical protein